MTNDELEKYYINISQNPLEHLSKYIAPHLVGQEWYWIRRAILMMLATQNDMHIRNRLHMLLIGEPGTGKTELLLYIQEHLQGIMINAELTSKVGLVGDARGNKITPGLLAELDGNLLLTDELDKMPPKDQNGLLQALEEGYYSVVKGKHRERYKAEVRVIGTVNILEKIQKPLLDRFDFIFQVGTTKRQERADGVDRIVNSFTSGQQDNHSRIILRYLEWIKNHDANMLPGDEKIVKNLIRNYILQTQTNIDMVSYRSLELSILRISYAMARLEKTSIQERHVNDAIWLKDQILRGIVGVHKPNQYRYR